MEGLSVPANQIIGEFSKIEILKEYQLVGGTAITLQIQHRLSDDLDFCKWVPDPEQPEYAVNPKSLHNELSSRFGKVQTNHLGFSQVNFLVENPEVKATFYHTGLQEPTEKPLAIIGNIHASDLRVWPVQSSF